MLPILFITLMPGDATSAAYEPWERICAFCGERAASDAVLNALLFLPFGWVLGGRKGWIRAVVWGAALSVSLEAGQLFLSGRFTSIGDVAANTLGAGWGAWSATRRARGIAAWAALSGMAMFAPALLLKPAPTEGVYYGQWTAEFGNMEVYEGRILDVQVGEVAVPSWKTPYSAEIRESLRTGDPVAVRVELGPPPHGEAPIFSMADERQRFLFWLGADGDDVFVRLWRVGTTLRFGMPTWWWKGALAGHPVGEVVEIVYELGPRGPCLTLQGSMRCLTAGSSAGSWSLLSPGGQGDRMYLWGSLVWAFLLGIPMGLLGISPKARGFLVLGTTAGVILLSTNLPYWPTPWIGLPLFLLGASLASMANQRMELER